MMNPRDLVVPPRSQPFTPPLVFLAVPLSLLLGNTVDDGEQRIAKRYGLDRLTPVVQQQVASEARSHRLSTSSSWLKVSLRW